MNPTDPQVSSNSEDYQLLLVSPCNSRDNTISPPEQVTENFLQNEDVTQNNDISIVSPLGQVAESFHPREDVYHVTSAAQPRSPYQQATVVAQNQILPVHPTIFFYRPPKDFYHYHVN